MTIDLIKGTESHLYPAEELVPNYDWLSLFMKVADRCVQKYPLKFNLSGYQYTHADYWRTLIFKALTQQVMKAATDELNDILADLPSAQPKSRNQFRGSIKRCPRLTPHESQMHLFVKKLPRKFKDHLIEEIFHTFLEVALELGIISKNIKVKMDYTNKWYYGLVHSEEEDGITGTNEGPGTKWTRKYAAVMIASGTIKLFAGLFLTQKGKSKVPDLVRIQGLLREWGFNIQEVHGDREFSNYDLIATLKKEDIPYLGSMKRTPAIKPLVDQFLDGKIKAVIPHLLKPSAATKYKLGDISTFLIFKTDPGTRVKDLRMQLKMGSITREQAVKHIHIFITTFHAPRNKRKWIRWGMGLVRRFSKRWQIETGFRDMNRILPTSHARKHSTKTLMFAMQMWNYNIWQIQRASHRHLRRVPKSWRMGPTLDRFSKRLKNQIKLSAALPIS
jgi:hypothetical protein